jgi:hypothetical protein
MPGFFGGRTIMKYAIGEDAAAAAGGGEVPRGAGAPVPEAARRPLRELMDDRLLDALLERCGVSGSPLFSLRAGSPAGVSAAFCASRTNVPSAFAMAWSRPRVACW